MRDKIVWANFLNNSQEIVLSCSTHARANDFEVSYLFGRVVEGLEF